MRQFELAERPKNDCDDPSMDRCIDGFRKLELAIASAIELPTSLRPEVSLLMELYHADLMHERLTVSSLGLIGGIAPTTSLRYLEMLAKCGAVRRVSHEHDGRMSYVSLTRVAREAIDRAIRSTW